MAVTIKDIAKRSGYSFATVSRALNDRYGIDPKTLKKIKAVAEEMGYRPNQIAKSLVSRKTKTIGLIVPDLANPFFSTLLFHIKSLADASDYSLLICMSAWDPAKEEHELKLLFERRCDGILLYPSDPIDAKALDLYKIPICVFSDQEDDRGQVFFVGIDNEYGGEIATEHLFDQGYKRPAFLGGNQHSASSIARCRGYENICKKQKVNLPEAFISTGAFTIDSGYDRARTLLAMDPDIRPDAFFCANDLIAMGAMEAVTLDGLRVGADIGIVGVDNVIYAGLPQIRLTTMDIPLAELAKRGWLELMDLLTENGDKKETSDEKKASSSEEKQVNSLLEPTLVIRETTDKSRRKK